MDAGGELGSAAKGLAIGLEVVGSVLVQLPFFHSLLFTMCSSLACFPFGSCYVVHAYCFICVFFLVCINFTIEVVVVIVCTCNHTCFLFDHMLL